MGRGPRTIQWVGLGLVALSAYWPTLDVRALPPPAGIGAAGGVTWIGAGLREIPAQELGTAVLESVRGPDLVQPLWDVRRWYPWYLTPLWALALVAIAVSRGRRRRFVGAAGLLLSALLIAFEAAYLRAEYLAFLPGWLGRVEMAAAWLFIIAILLYRRRADRRLGAVEATLGAQALLGFVHGLTLPATMFRQWLDGRDPGAVLQAVLHNFPPAFWIGMAGLLIMALPVYLRREPRPAVREEGE